MNSRRDYVTMLCGDKTLGPKTPRSLWSSMRQLSDFNAPPTAPAFFKTALRRILGLVNETAVRAHSRQVKRESTVSQDSGPGKTHTISVSERVNPASFLPQPVKTPANAESIQFYISDNTKQCRLVSTLRNTIGSWEMEINVNILALWKA